MEEIVDGVMTPRPGSNGKDRIPCVLIGHGHAEALVAGVGRARALLGVTGQDSAGCPERQRLVMGFVALTLIHPAEIVGGLALGGALRAERRRGGHNAGTRSVRGRLRDRGLRRQD